MTTAEQMTEAEAKAYWESREGLAERLMERAKRLHSLIHHNAPEIIIESARVLVFKSLMTFPVDEGGRVAAIALNNQTEADQHEALVKAGYYVTLMSDGGGEQS